MKSIICALSALTVLSTAMPAAAQNNDNRPPVVVVAAPQPSQQALDLSRRLISLTLPDFEKQLNDYVRVVSAELGMASHNPQMATWFEKNAGPMMMPHLRTLLDDMAALYAEQLSISELEAIVGFYDTPMGREIARKQLKLQLDLSIPLARMQERYTNELMADFCKQFDCGDIGGAASDKSGRR